MQLTARERDKIFSRLWVIGVPREILVPYIRDIEKWIECSGLEWTISRIKSIKLDLLRKKAGLDPTSSWIRKGSKGSWFSGSVGALERWGFRESNFPKLIQALNVYTNFFSPKVTDLQAKKFLSGVLADPVGIPFHVQQCIDLGIALSGIRSKKSLPRPKPLLTYTPSSKRAPSIWNSDDEVINLIDSVAFLSSDGGQHYYRFHHLYDDVLVGLEPEILFSLPLDLLPEDLLDVYDLVVGKIGIIQEPGFKLRAVANPGRVFQRVLEPLGTALFNTLRDLSWDCTFNQKKADPKILAALQDGRTVYSVDLTGATDYFPLDLQILVLKSLFPEDYVDLFREISKGLWRMSLSQEIVYQYDREIPQGFLRWKKGQPLGLYPSFASFALTHGLLLLGLLGKPYNGEFYVLGDDVIILDTVLYQKYRVALELLGCPVSDSKTISSASLAEFTSRIFLDSDPHPIPQLKWRQPSDDSFIDVVRLLGIRGLLLLSNRQRKVAGIVASIPDFMGGLGFNPDGLDLSTRMKPFLSLLDKQYVPVNRLTDYSGQTRKLIHQSKFSRVAVNSYDGHVPLRDLHTIEDLDQRSLLMVHDTLGSTMVPWFGIMGTNLDLVLNGNIDLPGIGVPSRRTALQKWEGLLVHLLGIELP